METPFKRRHGWHGVVSVTLALGDKRVSAEAVRHDGALPGNLGAGIQPEL